MPGQSTLAPVIGESIIELEIAPTAGPGWLGTGAAPVTVSLTAETVRLDGTHLHFLTGDKVVRTVPREDVAAMTWKGHPPRRRPPGYRNVGALWTDEEREQLTSEVISDMTWTEISRRHERSTGAVRREAVRLRLVDELGRRLDPPPATGPDTGGTAPHAADASGHHTPRTADSGSTSPAHGSPESGRTSTATRQSREPSRSPASDAAQASDSR
jgi:hypothetical protein